MLPWTSLTFDLSEVEIHQYLEAFHGLLFYILIFAVYTPTMISQIVNAANTGMWSCLIKSIQY